MAAAGHNPAAQALAQDPSELFAIMRPPSADFDPFKDRPVAVEGNLLKTRAQVHADADWHRSVHVWVVAPPGSAIAIAAAAAAGATAAAPAGPALLLQKRSASKDTFPGRWDISAAGHITGADDSRETAVREVAEELGLCVPDPARRLPFVFTAPAEQAPLGGCNCFEDVYVLEYADADAAGGPGAAGALAIGAAEVEAVRWLTAHQLRAALQGADPAFVPRTEAYVRDLWAYLGQRYGGPVGGQA